MQPEPVASTSARPTRNRGAYLLARSSATQETIAEKVGVSRQAVAKWCSGAARPDDERRRKLSRLYRVPVAAWDEDVATQVAASATQPAREVDTKLDGTAEGVLAEADQLEDDVRELRRRAQSDGGMTPLEFGRILAITGDTLLKVARIRRGLDVVQHPDFRRAVAVVETALRGHPAAAEAVRVAMQAFSQTQS